MNKFLTKKNHTKLNVVEQVVEGKEKWLGALTAAIHEGKLNTVSKIHLGYLLHITYQTSQLQICFGLFNNDRKTS